MFSNSFSPQLSSELYSTPQVLHSSLYAWSDSQSWLLYVMSCFFLQEGATALHMASQEGHTETVQVLLEHSGDVNQQAQVIAIKYRSY